MPPEQGVAIALFAAFLVGRGGSTERGGRTADVAASIVGVLFVLLGPLAGEAAWALSSVSGSALVGGILLAAVGAVAGIGTRSFGRPASLGPAGTAAAGASLVFSTLTLLPRVGAVGASLCGLALVAAASWIPGSRSPEARSAGSTGSTGGFAAGVTAGGGLLLFFEIAGSSLSPTLPVLAVAGGGLLVGSAGAGVFSRMQGGRTPPGLAAAPALVAVCYAAARSPDLLGAAAELGWAGLPWTGLCLAAASGFVLGLGGGRAGQATGRGAAAGLLVAWALLSLAGDGVALLVLTILLVAAALPGVLAVERRGLRTAALVLPLAALWPAIRPLPIDARHALGPHSSLRDSAALAARLEGAPRGDVEVLRSVGGSVLLVTGAGAPRLWETGSTRVLDDRAKGPDLYFGHLATLHGGVPKRAVVLGSGLGGALDGLRRGGATDILSWEPVRGLRTLAGRFRDWNRSVLVDPAVRQLRVAPRSGEFDVILVDLPAPSRAGAGSAWSARSIERIATRLTANGTAVLRVPLRTTSADELALLARRASAAFEGLTAWLDPAGADHLLFVGRTAEGRPDAAKLLERAGRPEVAEDLRRAGLSPEDLLERALADRPALLTLGTEAPSRDGAALAAVAGLRAATGGHTLPLSALSGVAADLPALFDLSGLEEEKREEVAKRLTEASRVRGRYLEMLAALASGEAGKAMAAAERLGGDSRDTSGDLRALTEPWIRRGDGMMARGLYDQALAELLVAWSFAKNDREVNLKLGAVYRHLGRTDSAARHYEQVLGLTPSDLDATLGLADVRRRERRLAAALALLEEAERSHPGSFPLLVNLAHVQTELAVGSPSNVKERLGAARRLFQRAAAIEPLRPEPRAGLASVYYREEQYDRALEEINRAMTLQDSCNYRYWRGIVLLQTGKLDEAASDLQDSLLACPDNVDARNALGVVQVEQGRFEQGRATWEEILRRNPGNAEATAHLERFFAAGYDKLDRGDTGR